jgi:uncharacterized sporulation protein YeaH/YhbH (DUF444 family)
VLRPARPEPATRAPPRAAIQDGELKLLLELKIDDIIDWLWDELKLPDLKPRPGRRRRARAGARRLGQSAASGPARPAADGQEAVKRRAIQPNPVAFTDDDLRYRQLARRPRPATNAAVIFVLDVSASMAAAERQLAKSFFFFALQGIRRQYRRVEMRFVAHTTAWSSEKDFFEVSGSGGTVPRGFRSVDLVHEHYDPAQYNSYLLRVRR